jgi:hypothetical protein
MIRMIVASASLLLVSGYAWAEGAPAGGPDMSKMGPWTRTPKDEKATKKEINDLFKQSEDFQKAGDQAGLLGQIDFPVFMMTDDSKGVPSGELWNQEKYISVMKPAWDNKPKDSKMTHKLAITVLSDSLADVIDDFSMTEGRHRHSGTNTSVLVKRDGHWKWKVMVEAGWGDMNTVSAPAAAAPAAAPPAAAPKPPAAK